ncbi:hypothetical protein BGZ83_002658 [Gryganskiella cystojenkinii]|nr:hypothetical protein BGZ83_002658 [Gryganskiella cystojenkinii]
MGIPSDQDMWITYHILLYAGKEFPKVYHWMLRSEYFAKLKYQIFQFEASKMQTLAVNIMFEICRVQSLKPCDLALVDEDFLHFLLDLVERTRTDADELLNYGTIKLLLAFNEQFMLHKAACQATVAARANSGSSTSSQDHPYTSPSKVLHYSGNPLLYALSDRPGASTTFGENLIFMLNRAEESSLQMLILKLLYLLLTSTLPSLREFFYTNDLRVLVDVVIRELWDLPEEEESLRHAYLRVMGPLLTNTPLRHSTYKRTEIVRILDELGGGGLDEVLRRQLREQEAKERMLEQSRSLATRATYRDRRIISNGHSAPASPSISHATTATAAAAATAAAQAAAKSRVGTFTAGVMAAPKYGGHQWTQTPSACPSPILAAETIKKDKLKSGGVGSSLRYGHGYGYGHGHGQDSHTEQQAHHTENSEQQQGSGSIILESVLPPSSNNSSTNLHVHVSAPPPSAVLVSPMVIVTTTSEPIRRDSQPRASSPTTLRLVERVLREWLESCESMDGTTSSSPESGLGRSMSSLSLQDTHTQSYTQYSGDNNNNSNNSNSDTRILSQPGAGSSFPSSLSFPMTTSPTLISAPSSLDRGVIHGGISGDVEEDREHSRDHRIAIPVAH